MKQNPAALCCETSTKGLYMVGVKGTHKGVLRLLEPRNGGRLLVPFNLQRSGGRELC